MVWASEAHCQWPAKLSPRTYVRQLPPTPPAWTCNNTNEKDALPRKASENRLLLSDNENALRELGIKASLLQTLIPDGMGNAVSPQTSCVLYKQNKTNLRKFHTQLEMQR